MAPRYAKLFKGDLEEELLKDCDKKLLSWWRYIGDIFMIWQYGEKEPEKFLKFLNCYHSTVTFTTNYNYSWEEIILDVSVRKKITNLSLVYISNQQTCINICMLAPLAYITLKNPYLTIRYYG